MYHTIHPVIQFLCFACLMAGFWLPFMGYWSDDITGLHLLAMCGFFAGMTAGYGAAIIRDA